MRMSGGQESLRCDYCKNIYFSGPDDQGVRYLDEMPDLLCPVCAVPLWNATLAGVPLRACKRCRGMLVAMGAFEGLIEQARAEHRGTQVPATSDVVDPSRKLECPSCHHTMDSHFYYGGGHVVMEDCERCEVNWLDGGALMRIVRAPHQEEAKPDSF
jgi:Zn-finger nucleic acid-binding protein